ncbi:MAG TPA: hypothetical protein VND93_18100, partial [Myxococcales bacterium]|nr:hypothetical protein [Myxococcales bacterium]
MRRPARISWPRLAVDGAVVLYLGALLALPLLALLYTTASFGARALGEALARQEVLEAVGRSLLVAVVVVAVNT